VKKKQELQLQGSLTCHCCCFCYCYLSHPPQKSLHCENREERGLGEKRGEPRRGRQRRRSRKPCRRNGNCTHKEIFRPFLLPSPSHQAEFKSTHEEKSVSVLKNSRFSIILYNSCQGLALRSLITMWYIVRYWHLIRFWFWLDCNKVLLCA